MKKVFFLGAFAVLGLASCKKDYTCECTTTGGGTTITQSTTVNGTKKDAKAACENGSSTVLGITTTCTIK
ncbi:MAG: hypothetical protein ACK457_12955 [Flavobacteriia bacterium]|jgi:hypothetical protein